MDKNKCQKCGNQLIDPDKYCSICGAELQQNEGDDLSSPKVDKLQSASKRRKLALVLLSIAALVIAGIVIGLLFYKCSPKKQKDNQNHSEIKPVEVITPPSLSDEKVSNEKFVQVLVGPDGKVYLGLAGTRDESVLPSEKFREEVLTTAYGLYNQDHPEAMDLSSTQITEFGRIGTFGVPMNKLPQWLDMSIEERDELLRKEGIPIEDNSAQNPNSRTNEFQRYWLTAIKKVLYNHELDKYLHEGQPISVKAGKDTPYHNINIVTENLETANLNKYILMTSLKSEE